MHICDVCEREATYFSNQGKYCHYHEPLGEDGREYDIKFGQTSFSYKYDQRRKDAEFLVQMAKKFEPVVATEGYGRELRRIAGRILSYDARIKRIVDYERLDQTEFPPGAEIEEEFEFFGLGVDDNYTGRLNTICQKMGIEPPEYRFKYEGQSHAPTCHCTGILEHAGGRVVEKAIAGNKKTAKHKVALRILRHMSEEAWENGK